MKKVCMANPAVLCEDGNLSPTKARKGSIEMLMDASNTHNKTAAIQSMVDCGIRNSAIDASTAPMKKKGLLLPHRLCQVRSLKYPMIGCTSSPVSGAATHKNPILSISAPSV